eukprot:gnl/MRDRNA2_/MRDRNA2_80348_c0_seq1.p1 gnl/MRDRNA2_/MRDRNA2_80348_c0~~gnl/MRDRNA2_/MRDRNA2_80348_c0_seq1.p1  ORF type:complete len:272 (+),score=48.02 gnl/MRDRNA2_/MRDRNA2_80348_c0_seq1:29-817(+)
MPRHVLLRDLRQRLLFTYPSVPDAFRMLAGTESRWSPNVISLGPQVFTAKLLQWNIAEEEARKLFQLIDQDRSGTISLEELKEALREVAPWASLNEFWCKFAIQWPDIAELAGNGAQAHRRATEKLFASISPSNHPVQLQLKKEIPDTLTKGAFIEICSQLDITDSNAVELFVLCTASAKWQCRPGECNVDVDEYALDDFFTNLDLYAKNSLSKSISHLTPSEMRRSSANAISKFLSPVRGILNAVKGQLPYPQKESPKGCG